MQFTKATKTQAKLRLWLAGPSGSGKTYTAMKIASAMGKRIAVIDTEFHSASKYADLFTFDALNLDVPSIPKYEEAIKLAVDSGYDMIVIDSLTHAWYAAQELIDMETARSKSANSFAAWGKVTPTWNAFLRRIITTNAHVIGTVRSKVDYVIETVSGKNVPKKVGMAPIMREGAEYEFDVSGEMDLEHRLIIGKTRCSALDGQVYEKPGENVAAILSKWLSEGAAENPPEDAAVKQLVTELTAEIRVASSQERFDAVKSKCAEHREQMSESQRSLIGRALKAAQDALPKPAPKDEPPKDSPTATVFNAYKVRIDKTAATVPLMNSIKDDISGQVAASHLTPDESERLNEMIDEKMKTA